MVIEETPVEEKKEVSSKHPTKGFVSMWIKVTLPNVCGMILGKFSIHKSLLEEGELREVVKREIIKKLKLDECVRYKPTSRL